MRTWLLLIHQIPARPLYLRARVRALLARAGAVALKNSVYAAPASEGTRATLLAVAGEIRERDGEAVLCEARFDEADEQRLVDSCRRDRAEDYADLRQAAEERPVNRGRLLRLEKQLERISAVDFFEASGRLEAEAAFQRLRRKSEAPPAQPWAGRTWVTRRGVHVDRMGCAWFVRRFLDPAARFRFVPSGQAPRAGEVGFDMPGGMFTHEGDRCSLETLIARTGHPDAALQRIAEIVHDIDLKDGKFGREETAGVTQVIAGIVAAEPSDEARIQRGAALFDDLYRAFRGKPQPTLPKRLLGRRRGPR